MDENLQGFIDEILKLVDYMGAIPTEKAKLAAYQLKDVTQVFFDQWRDERPLREGLFVTSEENPLEVTWRS